jgi:hypothetical protein
MKKLLGVLVLFLGGCIGTDIVPDFVEPTIVIENSIVNLQVGDTFQLTAVYFDSTGSPTNEELLWSTSDDQVLEVSGDGLIEGISIGVAIITAQRNEMMASVEIEVSMEETEVMNARTADIRTTSSYPLSGIATLTIDGSNSRLDLSEDFSTTDRLPGLYLYLTNNPGTINGALELGPVEQFEGAQTYEVPDDVELFTYNYVLFYCKPFTVKVGDGELMP